MDIADILKALSDRLKGKAKTPIVVGGWAINLLGHARQTLDFDFMILENDFEKIAAILNELGYAQSLKTPMYARFESKIKSDTETPYMDCLFADKNTYDKLTAGGKKIDIMGAEFILPSPIHAIAMKLHALKYSDSPRQAKDFDDIIALVEIYKIDISEKSDFENVCKKYGTDEILNRVRNALS